MRVLLLLPFLVGCGVDPKLSDHWKGEWPGEMVLEFPQSKGAAILSGPHTIATRPALMLTAYRDSAALLGLCGAQEGGLLFTGSGDRGSWSGEQRCGVRDFGGCDNVVITITELSAEVGASKFKLTGTGNGAGCGYVEPATFNLTVQRTEGGS